MSDASISGGNSLIEQDDRGDAAPELAPEVQPLKIDADKIQASLESLSARLDQMAENVEMVAKQVSYLPPQVRMLVGKIDNVSTSISESRYQALLLRILGIYDLSCQMLANTDAQNEGQKQERQNYVVLSTQIQQLLEVNGLSMIRGEGKFDPQLHFAIESVPCDDESLDSVVLEVVRPGFRTEQSVLRFAEVKVGQFRAKQADGNIEQVTSTDLDQNQKQ